MNGHLVIPSQRSRAAKKTNMSDPMEWNVQDSKGTQPNHEFPREQKGLPQIQCLASTCQPSRNVGMSARLITPMLRLTDILNHIGWCSAL